jgi:16S rRNA (guanine966-N2)-methyltransferase
VNYLLSLHVLNCEVQCSISRWYYGFRKIAAVLRGEILTQKELKWGAGLQAPWIFTAQHSAAGFSVLLLPGLHTSMKNTRHLRIIGGQWKSRKIPFPDLKELRPSPDAVRETLFNWLRNDLADSNCLDLYAGSGAFGFEAVSRGASSVVMVDNNHTVIKNLYETRELLNAGNLVEIYHGAASQFLETTTLKFDVIFIDPPFKDHAIQGVCQSIIDRQILNHNAKVYIESPKSNLPLPIPATWHIIRESQRGMVQSTLIST